MIEPDLSSGAMTEFAEFFAARYERAVRGAYLLTSSQEVAEDVTQDAFRQVFERWALIRRPEAYLWRAITSGARSWGRRERRARRAPFSEVTQPIDSDALVVREALTRLSAAQREALVLHHYLGLTDREIADALERPIGTVKSHLRRGHRALRKALE